MRKTIWHIQQMHVYMFMAYGAYIKYDLHHHLALGYGVGVPLITQGLCWDF